jgi:pimeloyl-ACP methyl ester carboxylesterase
LRLDVTKVYGSEDGLASEEEVTRYTANLPDATHWVRIEGANHTQFGSYGWQLGDDRAQITRAEQQTATVHAILEQLQRVAANKANPGRPNSAQ